MSRQLVQIFVHSKSLHRYLELSCPLFKLPFSYPSHPLQLFSLLFCLFLSCLFPIPFTRYYCSLFYFVSFLSCFFPIHFTRYNCSPCYSVFFLNSLFSYPFHPSQLFFLLLCLLLSTLSPPPPNHRYCFLLLLCLLLPCPFFTFLSHFLIVVFPCYFSSTKAYFRQVLTLFFCSILSLLSITKPSIYVFICTYFHVII